MNMPVLLLRDIHWPAPISWWPPAPGWWGVMLVVVVFGWWRRRRQQGRRRQLALADWQRLAIEYTTHRDGQHLAQELSALLRRVALAHTTLPGVAGLTGESWLRFLEQGMPGQPFTAGPGRILLSAPFRPTIGQPAATGEMMALLTLCRDWLETRPWDGEKQCGTVEKNMQQMGTF